MRVRMGLAHLRVIITHAVSSFVFNGEKTAESEISWHETVVFSS